MSEFYNFMNPETGMGVTRTFWSDRKAYTISRVSASGKTFWMKEDKVTRVDKNGWSESQEYSYEPDSDSPEIRVGLTSKGWRVGGQRGERVTVGVRNYFYDFAF